MIQSKKILLDIKRPGYDDSKRINILRLEKNERTTLFSKGEFDKILETITPFDLTAYGELEPLYQTVCNYLNINRSELLLTAGSDIGIKSIFETFITEGDEFINFFPNYAMFSVYGKMFGAREIVKNYNEYLKFDILDLINSINYKTRLIVISNPGHNGVLIPNTDLLLLLEKTKNTNCIILIDEAYIDFTNQTMIEYIKIYEHLLITRTLSKAFGLAAIRVGFLIGCKNLISELYKVKAVHEVDGVASKIAKYLIENLSIKNKYLNSVKEGKNILYNFFRKMNIDSYPSDTNFVYFRLDKKINPNIVVNELINHNIYIKGTIDIEPFKGYLRTTVGDKEQMEILCKELEFILIKLKK